MRNGKTVPALASTVDEARRRKVGGRSQNLALNLDAAWEVT